MDGLVQGLFSFWLLLLVQFFFSLFFIRFFNLSNDKFFLVLNLFFVGFWFSFKNHLAQTVFWAVGGVYVFNLFLFSVWLYLVFFSLSVLAYIMSFVVGMTTQNLVPIAFCFSFYLFFLKRERKLLINIILLFLGLLIISVMPGNFKRLGYNEVSLLSNFFKNFIYVTLDYSIFSKYALIVGTLSGFLLIPYVKWINYNRVFCLFL